MEQVNPKIYAWYNRTATGLAAIYLLLTIGAWVLPQLAFLQQDWGFNPIIIVIALVQIVYGVALYPARTQLNPWTATLFTAMIISLAHISLIHNSGQLHSPLLILWVVQVLTSGVFGSFAVVGMCFLVTIYYVIIATGDPTKPLVDPFALGVVVGSYVLGALSYLLFKSIYIDRESARLSQLSGQLQDTQKQAEILVQSIPDGVIVTDREGKISLFNPASEKLTGWPVNEALGIDIKLVVKLQMENGKELPEDQNPFRLVLKSSQPVDTTLRLIRKDKTFTIASVVATPVISQKGQQAGGVAVVIRDISAARLEENRRAEFISTASHEMRTPVAAIEGYLQLAMNDKVARIDSKARSFLDKALDSTHHLGQLFQDLLTSAKAEDGRIVSHPSAIEMGEFMQKLSDGLRFAAEKKGLLLDFKVGASSSDQTNQTGGNNIKPLYYAYADPDRIQEVITNLFDNAVKYTDKGKVTVGLTGNMEVVQLFIKDTGAGIPKEDIPHLFQKFYRVDNSATRTVGGTGLGLFICKQIIDLYHGRIWVESESGQGSTFFINLPRLSSQKAMEMQQQAATSAQL